MADTAVCALCEANAQLKQSHLIPHFVSRALKMPDSPPRALLCGECEDLFGGHESTFARVVFHPLLAKKSLVVKYEKWLLQFATSVCWRVLQAHVADNPSAESAQLTAGRETWRQFLRGKRPDIDAHPIHLLIDGGIEMEAAASGDGGFVCARLGPVTLLGLVTDPDRTQWQGTRIHVAGKLKPRETVVPARYREYLSGLSRRSR